MQKDLVSESTTDQPSLPPQSTTTTTTTTTSVISTINPTSPNPMFFSLDVIWRKSLHVLEMNVGYVSSFAPLGDDMTHITYLQSLRGPEPVIVVCRTSDEIVKTISTLLGSNIDTELATIGKLKGLAQQVLTKEEQANIYFLGYKEAELEPLSSLILNSSSIDFENPLNKINYAFALKMKLYEIKEQEHQTICQAIKKFAEEKHHQLWPGRTPKIVVIESGVQPTRIRNLLKNLGINYPVDSSSLLFQLQCYDKAFQRIMQNEIMPPVGLINFNPLLQEGVNFLNDNDLFKRRQEAYVLWQDCWSRLQTLKHQSSKSSAHSSDEIKSTEIKSTVSLEELSKQLAKISKDLNEKNIVKEQQQLKTKREKLMNSCIQFAAQIIGDISDIKGQMSNDFQDDKYPQVVLKPLAAFRGQGVIVCPMDSLLLGQLLFSMAITQGLKLEKIKEELTHLISGTHGGGLADDITQKGLELMIHMSQNNFFFLVELFINREPIVVTGAKKMVTWRFIVETLNGRFGIQAHRQGKTPAEQQRRIFGKLPPLVLPANNIPTTGSSVSYVGERESEEKNSLVYLPTPQEEKQLINQFSYISSTLEKSLNAGFYEFLIHLADMPASYQQYFHSVIISDSYYLFSFSQEDLNGIARFINEKGIKMGQELLTPLMEILAHHIADDLRENSSDFVQNYFRTGMMDLFITHLGLLFASYNSTSMLSIRLIHLTTETYFALIAIASQYLPDKHIENMRPLSGWIARLKEIDKELLNWFKTVEPTADLKTIFGIDSKSCPHRIKGYYYEGGRTIGSENKYGAVNLNVNVLLMLRERIRLQLDELETTLESLIQIGDGLKRIAESSGKQLLFADTNYISDVVDQEESQTIARISRSLSQKSSAEEARQNIVPLSSNRNRLMRSKSSPEFKSLNYSLDFSHR